MFKKDTAQKDYLKKKAEFEQKFYRLMFELGLYNKFNKTYYLNIIEQENYGFKATIHLVDGLVFSDLESQIGKLQQSLCCIWIMKTIQFKAFAELKIVTQPLDAKYPYSNPKIKPWELYMGLDFALKPIINDNNKNQMFLIAGSIGAGKTRFLYTILLSWILSCSPEEVEIYLSDIAKNEFVLFQYCQHVKAYASELEQLQKMMKRIKSVIDYRNRIITRCREQGTATNISEYNKISKTKLSYCYIVIDEFSVVVPDKSDTEEEKEAKQEIIDTLKKVSKIGRSLGIFTIICLQKTTKEEMGASILKNMAAVRISFRANDQASSEVIIGDSSAVGLGDRYAVYSLNGGDRKDYLFSPCLSTEMLKTFLEPYRQIQRHIQEKTKPITEHHKQYSFPKMPVNEILKMLDNKGKAPAKVIKLKGGEFVDY